MMRAPVRNRNREFGRKRWGDAGYAAEELVAELGAAFLCADLGITPEPREDHAAYLVSWLDVLKNDKRAILTSAAHAQKAADFLHGLQAPMIHILACPRPAGAGAPGTKRYGAGCAGPCPSLAFKRPQKLQHFGICFAGQ
jgi:hypothetical protein